MTRRHISKSGKVGSADKTGLDKANIKRRSHPLSDNGPSYVSSELADWLEEHGIKHTRGKPCHLQTQGKIERWHRQAMAA